MEHLICINCKSNELVEADDKISCRSCKSTFPIVNGIPAFIEGSYLESFYTEQAQCQDHIMLRDHDCYWIDYISYFYQVDAILKHAGEKILEIGIGNKAMKALLENKGYAHTGVDIDPKLNPDYVASVTNLPFRDNYADTVICFQCLEHIPVSNVPKAVSELKRVSKKNAIISVPDATYYLEFEATVFKKAIYKAIDLPFIRRRKKLSWGHQWEIGANGTKESDIVKILGGCISHYRIPRHRYHHLFVVDSGQSC